MPRDDAYILTGIDAIINPSNIKPGIDLKELEKKFINGGLIEKKAKGVTDRFNDELAEAAKRIGISFGEQDARLTQTSKLPSVPLDDPSDSEGESDDDAQSSPQVSPEVPAYPQAHSDVPPTYAHTQQSAGSYMQSESMSRNTYSRPKYDNADLHTRTVEQDRRSHIDAVMGVGTSEYSLDVEKQEGLRHSMLAEISSLRSSLIEEDQNLDDVPEVDGSSSMKELETVRNVLRYKFNQVRYYSLAEEFLLSGAYALEDLFDGKRTWFGRYRPDATGWHNQVNVKLRRLRPDTGAFIGSILQDNIGPGARIILELLPNFVLYTKMRKQQHGQPNLYSEDEVVNATENIRRLS